MALVLILKAEGLDMFRIATLVLSTLLVALQFSCSPSVPDLPEGIVDWVEQSNTDGRQAVLIQAKDLEPELPPREGQSYAFSIYQSDKWCLQLQYLEPDGTIYSNEDGTSIFYKTVEETRDDGWKTFTWYGREICGPDSFQ